MRMKAFCDKAGLSRETVNFYVRLGLIIPASNGSATNTYRDFDTRQVEVAQMIKQAKALGFSLSEIGQLAKRYRAAALDRDVQIALLHEQLSQLAVRRAALDEMDAVLRQKLSQLSAAEPTKNTG
jgi:DNA-binding transcriptional MerR regulator